MVILSADTVSGEYFLDTRAEGMQYASFNPKHDLAGGWGPKYYPRQPLADEQAPSLLDQFAGHQRRPMLREMLVPDDVDDNLDDEFYVFARFRMGDLHVAFLNVFARRTT